MILFYWNTSHQLTNQINHIHIEIKWKHTNNLLHMPNKMIKYIYKNKSQFN